ncbi:carbohydrate ABC transporter permease [Paenibacillus sp. P26]|nr:carbohydrate ABC transporter permease [Paenibacillus sp. P26]
MEMIKQMQAGRGQAYPMQRRLGRIKQSLPNILSIALMTVTSVPLVLLYVWIVLISFSSELIGGIFPKSFSLQNWSFLWSPNLVMDGAVYPNVWSMFGSTLTIALGTSVVEVAGSLMAGYVLSRGNFPGSKFLLQSTLLTHAFPAITGMIAAFYILNAVGLVNTLTGIILLKAFAGMGMSTWIIKGFFDEVPKHLEWASSVDGKQPISNVYPGISSECMAGCRRHFAICVSERLGEYVMVSVFLFDDSTNTLPMILHSLFVEEFHGNYGIVMALAVFYMLPCLILYFFSQQALMKMKM